LRLKEQWVGFGGVGSGALLLGNLAGVVSDEAIQFGLALIPVTVPDPLMTIGMTTPPPS
jgi:hypothetical protein